MKRLLIPGLLSIFLLSCTTTIKIRTDDGDIVKKVYYTKELKRYLANTAAGIPDSVACKKIVRILNRDRYHKTR